MQGQCEGYLKIQINHSIYCHQKTTEHTIAGWYVKKQKCHQNSCILQIKDQNSQLFFGGCA